jgi:branched-chain amino acid transport system substrate-binding protein
MRAALSPDDILRRWDDMPTMGQAGVYSAVTHYLRAIEAAGTDEAKSVVAQMKATPVNDFFAHDGRIREDGRMIHDMYLVLLNHTPESVRRI